jgi:hypothetical protein
VSSNAPENGGITPPLFLCGSPQLRGRGKHRGSGW